ncbi:glycosyltransferase [Labilibaculum euxinus]
MKFSVLISVYFRENPIYFKDALESIWNEQDLRPDEIVLVKDGNLTEPLDKVIYDFSKSCPVLKIVGLKENKGLGLALAEGLKHCSFEYVARMDTDDISYPNRFSEQIKYLDKHTDIDVLGSSIEEFEVNPSLPHSYRKAPIGEKAIIQYAKSRNPMNHVTVIFKKQSVLKVGNYQSFIFFEDYHLWLRMILNDCNMVNLEMSLVKVRAGKDMIKRRRGLFYFNQELKMQKFMKKNRLINPFRFAFNISVRAIPRLFPEFLIVYIYKLARKV